MPNRHTNKTAIISGGVAGAASGRLYVGNQVFSRTPLTGWPARLSGLVVSVAVSLVMFFACGLMQLGG